MLNGDRLGAKGEARFIEICMDAGLECNKSDTRDRTGWDFIVEFPFEEPDPQLALEKRRAPVSCHVQVKTIREGTKTVKLRLSSAEFLAKETKPTFIYIFVVGDDLSYRDSQLIHLLDEPLGKILKRLRQEDVANNITPNKSTITFSPGQSGLRLEPTGQALKDALQQMCGSNMIEYAVRKDTQRRHLGYEERPFEMKGTFHATDYADLADIFLGLRQDAEVTDFQSFESRFGIKKPFGHSEPIAAKISITPSVLDTCTLICRGDAVEGVATFKGRLKIPAIPGLPKEDRK